MIFCVYEKAEVLKNNLTYYGLGKEFGSIQMFPLSLSVRPSELVKERAATQATTDKAEADADDDDDSQNVVPNFADTVKSRIIVDRVKS